MTSSRDRSSTRRRRLGRHRSGLAGTDGNATATATVDDADNDPVTVTFVWKNGTTVVQTHSAVALTDELDLKVAGHGDAGRHDHRQDLDQRRHVRRRDRRRLGDRQDDGSRLQRHEPVRHVRRRRRAWARRPSPSRLWFKRTGAGSGTTTGTGGIAERDPARHEGPRRGRDAGQRQHELLPRHRRHERRARRRLRGHRQRRATTRSAGTTAVTSNVWHHAAATYDGDGTWRLYLDGVARPDARARRQLHAASRRASSTPRSARAARPTRPATAAGFFAGVDRRGPDLERRPHAARRSARPRIDEITSRHRPASAAGASTRAPARPPATAPARPTARSSAARPGSPATPFAPDITPPAAPTGLVAARRRRRRRPSTWTANSEADLAGYNVYRAHDAAGRHHRHAAQRRDAAPDRRPTPTRRRSSTARPTTTSSSRSTAPATRSAAADDVDVTPRPPPAHALQLQRREPVRDVRRRARPRRVRPSRSSVVPAHRRRRGHQHRQRRHRERDPADHQGPRRGRDAGQRQHELLPRHRRRDRRARRRLRGHRDRRATTRSAAPRPSPATSGTTPPRPTTARPGGCTSTACSTARSPSARSRPSRPASSTPRSARP